MQIVQVHRQFSPSTGGIENVVYGLSRALQQQGQRCDIATLRYIFSTGETCAPTAQIDGLAVYRFPHLGIRRYPIAPAVLSMVGAYDVVHIHAIDFFVDFLVATRALHRKPLIVSTHGGIFHTRWMLPLKKLFFQTITRLSLRGAAAVVCDSQHDYNLFRPIVPAHRLHIIANGIAMQPLLAIEKRMQPGLLLGIGRIVENKRVAELIDLLPALAAEVPHARLVWVGADQEQRRDSLLERAQRLGVAERVHFAGQVSDVEMHDLLAQAHLFVSASSYEAFGITTIEAMGSGTVPVVTPVGVHPEVVNEGQTGFLWRLENQAQAVAQLKHALRLDLAQVQQMGQAARQVARRYAWESVVQSYLNLYQQVYERNTATR
jgi:alpha-1,3-mannosyltransferase